MTNDLDEYKGELRCPRCRGETADGTNPITSTLGLVVGVGIAFAGAVLVWIIIKALT